MSRFGSTCDRTRSPRRRPAMRRAMAEAEVGDAWYGDDPTVEPPAGARRGAARHRGGALRAHRHDGQSDRARAARAHERTPGGVLGGLARGHDRGDDRGGAVRHRLPHGRHRAPGLDRRGSRRRRCSSPTPTTTSRSSISSAVENTVGGAGGRVMPLDELRAVRAVAERGRRSPVHLDGARLFNAAAALGVDAAEFAREADTVDVLRLQGARRADRIAAVWTRGD